MERVWAPWRKAYILGKKKPKGCLFCRVLENSPSHDFKNLILLRSAHSYVILNRFPYTNAHLMIVPNRHVDSPDSLHEKEQLDLFKMVNLSLKLLKKAFHPQGLNSGINVGKAAGAAIPHHMHFHVVPRWLGDTNFMPISSGTKVISDSLGSTYRHLKDVLQRTKKKE